MKLKMLGFIGLSAVFMALSAGSASATTLEWAGTTKNQVVGISASLASGTLIILSRTDGSLANACDTSFMLGKTSSPFTGTTVTGAIEELTFEHCTRPVTVHKAGTLHVEHTSGTNGTVSWSGSEVTYGSPFGTLNCKTGSGVDIGTLTGVSSGSATLHINAVLNCGWLVPSASWKGTYELWGNGLGVSA